MTPEHGLLHSQSEEAAPEASLAEQWQVHRRSLPQKRGRRRRMSIAEMGEEFDAVAALSHVLPTGLRGRHQDLPSIVAALNITALIGASSHRGAFCHATLKQMHLN